MKKVCVIGHFGGDKNFLDGQTIKTKIITKELKKQLGDSQVSIIDTYGGKKALIKCLFKCFKALKKHNNIIMLPAHNGVKFFTPVLLFLNLFFNRRLHYSVIGGWLPDFLNKHKYLKLMLKKFDFIYVETDSMKQKLCAMGFSNIAVVVNCKELNILKPEELNYNNSTPYKLCTFSRVMKEKGIETAINVIKRVNEKLGYIAYSLDIYGPVDGLQTVWFENLKKQFPDGVRYCGSVDADKSVEVLKQYFALIFPTHFYTEGIPGTIIDAYAAGIPLIFAKWESYSDVVEDGKTGLGYDFDNAKQFEEILLSVEQNPRKLFDMKENCISKAKNYMPESALQIMISKIR